jgi:peroxiredoxin
LASKLESQIASAEMAWLDHWKRGPTRIRWNRIPLQVGDQAPDFELEDATGQPVRLSNSWQHKPALLLFWRHYGCSCGIDRARRLQAEYPDYVKLGANVIVIGQGEPERAAAYAERHNLPCPVLCDPSRKVYEAYDLLEGKPSQVVFDASDALLSCDLKAGADLQTSRHGTERASVDSPWQLPGEFVVDQKGVIRLAYRYQYCEDWPNPLVLIAALKEILWDSG